MAVVSQLTAAHFMDDLLRETMEGLVGMKQCHAPMKMCVTGQDKLTPLSATWRWHLAEGQSCADKDKTCWC
jgi:hypothetical protein